MFKKFVFGLYLLFSLQLRFLLFSSKYFCESLRVHTLLSKCRQYLFFVFFSRRSFCLILQKNKNWWANDAPKHGEDT